MIRRPPRSTLFPYTDALPISIVHQGAACAGVGGFHLADEDRVVALVVPVRDAALHVREHVVEHGDAGAAALVPEAVEPVDRKSTRLNSSHANISYAVFCLKKK